MSVMLITDTTLRQRIASASALLEQNQAEQAMKRVQEIVAQATVGQLSLLSPDLRGLIERFQYKKKRDLSRLLDERLGVTGTRSSAGYRQSGSAVPADGLQPDVVQDFSRRLDELRDRHIFQWNTFYRETVGLIFKELVWRTAQRDEREVRDAAAVLVRRHAIEIFEAGFSYTTSIASAGTVNIAETKAVSGLTRFVHLIIDLSLQARPTAAAHQEARAIREVTSALISAVLGGFGDARFGDRIGWTILSEVPRAWVHALGYVTGNDATALAEPTDAGATIPLCLVENVLPVLVGLDRQLARPSSPSMVTRLCRMIGDPPRLEMSLALTGGTRLPDVTMACFWDGNAVTEASIEQALVGGTAVVMAPLSDGARQWLDESERPEVVDSSGMRMAPGAHVHDLAERVATVLELYLARTMAMPSSLLLRNYAREFPLEDSVLRQSFLVERHSVKSLLEAFEQGAGVHLWCSVRRSGKTTATQDLAGMTGRSVVIVQTMDQQPNQPDQNHLYSCVMAALQLAEPLPPGFFARVIGECAAAMSPIAGVQVISRKVVVVDEYETLFELLDIFARQNDDVRVLVVQPLLSQMVSFAATNLLILMGRSALTHTS